MMSDDDENQTVVNISLTEIRMDILELVVSSNICVSGNEIISTAKSFEDYIFNHKFKKENNNDDPTHGGLLN